MVSKIKKLIDKEDIKNPYTDEQIAQSLGLKREQVTAIRRKEGIPDSRERRKPYLIEFIRKVLESTRNLSEREITDKVKRQGFDVSRFIIRQYVQELSNNSVQPASEVKSEEKARGSAAEKDNKVLNNEDAPFIHIIGHSGSLKSVIMQAKASILYPPKGLNTLILGEPGVGKSDLAESMYNFAKKSNIISQSAPFVFFNCADYSNNHQLLIAQLFGYVKGAFTGAEKDKEGLVEKANDGILFLDEFHRLGPEGQEQLFYLIDKGCFRRLGETNTVRKANVMIILATTENPESTLLLTFRRRIPMVIELPSLAVRPLAERFELIIEFFSREATRTNTPIEVDSEVLRAMLLYECPGNIGQLWSDIQVSCARGFLNHIINQADSIKITVDDLPQHTRKGLLKIQNRGEVENLTRGNLEISPNKRPVRGLFKEDLYTLPTEIYLYIEQRYQQLQQQGMNDEVINSYIGVELENRFRKVIKNISNNSRTLLKTDLIKIVGIEIVDLVEKMLKIAERKMYFTGENLFYCLAIHLKTMLDRIREGKVIINPRLNKIKEEHPLEFKMAGEMVALVEDTFKIKLPEDEVGFIAMCILTLSEKEEEEDEGRIGIVVVSHGHVASGMADVANRLLGLTHAKAVEMSLDESPENALERVLDAVRNADEGKGVVLLVDMGSLVTFGEIITQKTGIKTRVIARTDTVLVIDAVRRSIIPGMSLDELASVLEEKPKYITRLSKSEVSASPRKAQVILTICITGEGSAIKVKELVENLLPEISGNIEIIPIGAMMGNTRDIISSIRMSKDIIAVVGTVNPSIKDIQFISIEDILKGSGITRLKQLLTQRMDMNNNEHVENAVTDEYASLHLENMFDPDLVVIDPDVKTKEEILNLLGKMLREKGYVKEDYISEVFERESLGTTYIGNHTVIPHADPTHIYKPGIAFAKLKNSIDWDSQKVSFVFMLALPVNSQNIVQELFELIKSKDYERAFSCIGRDQEFLNLITGCIKT